MDSIVITEKDFIFLLETGLNAAPIKKKVLENESSCVLGTRILIRVYHTACIFQKI